jgi:voltage-gated potassium channel
MRVKVPNPIGRSQSRFQDDPASTGNAVRLIIGVLLLAVFAGSGVIWLLDRRDFPDYGTALWYSLQTVTTVGYGDVTPTSGWGRIVGGVVMVVAVGSIAVITAAITSTFVEAAQRRRRSTDQAAQDDAFQRLETQLATLSERLERMEGHLGIDEGPVDHGPVDDGPSD